MHLSSTSIRRRQQTGEVASEPLLGPSPANWRPGHNSEHQACCIKTHAHLPFPNSASANSSSLRSCSPVSHRWSSRDDSRASAHGGPLLAWDLLKQARIPTGPFQPLTRDLYPLADRHRSHCAFVCLTAWRLNSGVSRRRPDLRPLYSQVRRHPLHDPDTAEGCHA